MRYKIICLALLLFGCASFASAQDETPTAVTVQNRTGDLPFSQTVGTGVEHVDIGSGNLIVEVPIVSLPGRHMPFNYGLRYNALFWTVSTRTQTNGQPVHSWAIERRPYIGGDNQGLGFTPTLPQLSWGFSQETCTNTTHTDEDTKTTASGYIYTDAGGGKHPLSILQVSATSPDGGCFAGQNGTGFFQGYSPAEGILARVSDIYSTPSVFLPDGTQVAWPTDNSLLNPPVSPDFWYPIGLGQYLDANGNSKCELGGCLSVDTLGRSPLTVVNGGNQILYQVYDSTGTQQTYTVNLGTISVQTNFGIAGVAERSQIRTMVTSIVLPNQTSYSFQYENGSYGGLTSITLPTGGTISYAWATLSPSGNPYLTHRYVSSRTVTVGGQVSTWTFSKSCGDSNCFTVNTDAGDPLGNHTLYQHTDGKVVSTKIYNGAVGGTLLRQYDVAYNPQPGDPHALPIRITTTLKNGLQTKVEYDYDTTGGVPGNVAEIREYGYGSGTPGALLRRTHKTYGLNTNANYLAANIVNKVTQEKVYDSATDTCRGVAGPCAQTQYEYDNYVAGENPLQTASGAAQHDDSGHDASFTLRGNLTRVKRWRNTDGAWLTTTYSYDELGNIRSIKDPLGHVTSYDYADSFANTHCLPPLGSSGQAYVSAVTNALTQRVEVVRYPCTALVQAHRDQNDIDAHLAGTTYTYDPIGRLLTKDLADGGHTEIAYNDVPPVSAATSTKITSALNLISTAVMDGVGRNKQAQLNSDPAGVDFTDTTYDLLGRVATVSNPYRSTSDSTYGTTSSQYDALGRVKQVTKQDGSISRVQYDVATSIAVNGDCTVTTDEAGKQRGACSDALGRLVEVDEPSGVAPQANYHALMQTDGNFVLLNSTGNSVWATGTGATNAASIFMQDDGNLVTYIFRWQAGVYAAPSPGPFPSSSCSIGTYLVAGEILPSGKCIVSPHGQYFLLMNTDGNFFIYDWAHGTGTWGPGTQGHPGAYAIFQTDGNLVVYSASGVALWSSGTSGTYAERLDMNDDGRIIIWKSAWNSGTSNGQFNGTTYTHPGCDVGLGTGTTGVLGAGQCFVSPNGRFELLMQTDGNMVIYDRSVTPNAPIWSTGTGLSMADPSVAYRTLYFYDVLGNLYCVEQHGDAASGTACPATPPGPTDAPVAPDPNNAWRRRLFAYDSLSRLRWASNPESGIITYAYDNDGNLLQKTSPAPNQTGTATQTVSYCYDELHRVTGRGYGAQSCPLATPVVTYAYDSGANAKGHLTSLTDQAGTASYGYDILGRLATETRTLTGANNASISKNLSYEYNLDGSLYKLHYPSGAVVTYTPDSAGRTVSAVDGGSGINYVTGATYGPDSALTGFVSGSGGAAAITSSFTYNKRLQPLTMSATAPSQTVFSIGYDFHAGNGTAGTGTDNGNVFGIINYKDTTHGRDQTFTYDLLNRLLTAQNAGTNCSAMVLQNKTEYWGNSYGYDAWGNLLQKTIIKCGAEHFSVTADAHNWIHSTAPDYQYDAAGNMTYDATASLSYTFDEENRLTGAAGYTYTYDADGNRVRKSNGNLAANGTLYWYMTPGVVAESDLAGTLKSEYVFFDGERVARRDGATGTGGVFYYFSDHLKTASVITDSAGVIKAESDYYPWGGELQFVNNDTNDYKFTGKKRDLETGLDYFGARYYSNGLGRWVSADWSPTPIPVPYADFSDPQSLNLYSYVRNVPTTRFDTDGHWPQFGPVLIQAAQEIANNPGKAWRDVKQSTVSFVQSVVNLLPVGDNKPTNSKYQSPRQDPPSTSAVGRLTTAGLAAGTAAIPGPKGATSLTKAEQLAVNAATGKAAEQAVVGALQAEGRQILGQQVGVQTSMGLRKVDILTQDAAGQLANVEVKSGDAVRSASQIAKDNEIATQGGTYVGKNAPDALRGQTAKVPTEVRKPDKP